MPGFYGTMVPIIPPAPKPFCAFHAGVSCIGSNDPRLLPPGQHLSL